MSIGKKKKKEFRDDIIEIEKKAIEQGMKCKDNIAERLKAIVDNIESTIPLIGFAQVGKSTWRRNIREQTCREAIDIVTGYRGIESQAAFAQTVNRTLIEDINKEPYYQGQKFIFFNFNLSDLDSAGEIWKNIAQNTHDSDTVNDEICQLLKKMLPYFPGYFLVVDKKTLKETGALGNLQNLVGAMYPEKKNNKLLKGQKERSIAIVFTKIDELPENERPVFLKDKSSSPSEDAVRTFINQRYDTFSQAVLNHLVENGIDYSVFAIYSKVTKADQAAEADQLGGMEELKSVGGEGFCIADPVVWMCKKLKQYKDNRQWKLFSILNIIIVILIILMITCTHIVPWIINDSEIEFHPETECRLVNFSVCWNPYAQIMRHFTTSQFQELKKNYENKAIVLIDNGEYDLCCQQYLPIIKWISQSSYNPKTSKHLRERINKDFAVEDLASLSKAVEYYISDIGNPLTFPDIVKKSLALIYKVGGGIDDLTPTNLAKILKKRSLVDSVPSVCQKYIDEGRVDCFSSQEIPADSSLDDIVKIYGERVEEYINYSKIGNKNIYDNACSVLNSIADEYFDKLKSSMKMTIDRMNRYIRGQLSTKNIDGLITGYEQLATNVPGYLLKYPQYDLFMKTYDDNVLLVELCRTKLLLTYSGVSYEKQVMEALKYWKSDNIDTKYIEVLQGFIEDYISSGKDNRIRYNLVVAYTKDNDMAKLLKSDLVYKVIREEVVDIVKYPQHTSDKELQNKLSGAFESLKHEKINRNDILSLYAYIDKIPTTHTRKLIVIDEFISLFGGEKTISSIKAQRNTVLACIIKDRLSQGKVNVASDYVVKLKVSGDNNELCQAITLFIDGLKKHNMLYVENTKGDAFYISKYEVTIRNYLEYIQTLDRKGGKARYPRYDDSQNWEVEIDPDKNVLDYYNVYNCADKKYDDYPIVGVDDKDAKEYCNNLSSLYNVKFSLPTLFQWREAAGKEDYPWGKSHPKDIIPENKRYGLCSVYELENDVSINAKCHGMGYNVQEIVLNDGGQYLLMGSCPLKWADEAKCETFKTHVNKKAYERISRHGNIGFRVVCDCYPSILDDLNL